MVDKSHLERQIEVLRLKMHQAIREGENYKKIVEVSKELDKLLNKLDKSK
ncbi:aspartyl-phosphate phosphatase Spo0E family protein [Halobacillus sp. B29]